MSQVAQTLPVAPTPSNFPAIFCASMKEYERKTKKDLLTHPLMAQLHTCDSPADILAVLRTQVQTFEESTRNDDKFTKWLNPTVNVLYAFSATLGAGVGLVNSFFMVLYDPISNITFLGILTCKCYFRWCRRPPFGSDGPRLLELRLF